MQSELAIVLQSPALQSRVRKAMRCSPVHRVEDELPNRIVDLLADLDQAAARRN